MASCFKFVIIGMCFICLILAEVEKETEAKSQPKTKAKTKSIDYSSKIELLETQLNKIDLTKYDENSNQILTFQTELNNINKRLDPIPNLVNELEERVNNIFSDTSSLINTHKSDLMDEISKMSASMSREVSDNKNRLEIIETTLYENDLNQIKISIENLKNLIQKQDKRNKKHFDDIKERFLQLDKSMQVFNSNINSVYDATLAASLERIFNIICEYCNACNEYIRNVIQNIDFKSYYDIITDPVQQKLFKNWLIGGIKYMQYWYVNGIRPAIANQITQNTQSIKLFCQSIIPYVHNHALYKELTFQSIVYMEQFGIPVEYNGLIIDVILVLFVLSSLTSICFILGLCSDCVCPRVPRQRQRAREQAKVKVKVKPQSIMNGPHHKNKKKKQSKKKK